MKDEGELESKESRALASLISASPVTGAAVAISEDGAARITCVGEFEGLPVSAHTLWPVASLTKPVFVYGALQLVQAGVLDLERPLASYLSRPYSLAEHFSTMTVQQAMCHTTGLPNWRGAEGLQAGFPPGTRFSYSGEGLHYLQHVVETVLGQPVEVTLQEMVFQPLGMTESALRRETRQTVSPNLEFLVNIQPVSAALSLWTTIEDYSRFMAAMWPGSTTSPSLLNDHYRTQMLTPRVAVGDQTDLSWGLGWGLQDNAERPSFWHWGARGIPRTMCFIVGWPAERYGITIFTNHADGLALCRDIIAFVRPGVALPAFDWLLPPWQWRADG